MFVRDIKLAIMCPGSLTANMVSAVAMYRMFPDGTAVVDQVGTGGVSVNRLLSPLQLEGLAFHLAETHGQKDSHSSGR